MTFSLLDIHYCWDYWKFYDTPAILFLTFSRNLRLYVMKKFIGSGATTIYVCTYIYTSIDITTLIYGLLNTRYIVDQLGR